MLNVIHTRRIKNGIMYDTSKAEEICTYHDDEPVIGTSAIFKTKNNRWFVCKAEMSGTDTKYSDIKPCDIDFAKYIIGEYSPDKYTELFGEVEEA